MVAKINHREILFLINLAGAAFFLSITACWIGYEIGMSNAYETLQSYNDLLGTHNDVLQSMLTKKEEK